MIFTFPPGYPDEDIPEIEVELVKGLGPIQLVELREKKAILVFLVI